MIGFDLVLILSTIMIISEEMQPLSKEKSIIDMSTKNILKSIISFFIIVASLNCSSQDRKIYELEKRMQFSIISDYHETGDSKNGSSPFFLVFGVRSQ